VIGGAITVAGLLVGYTIKPRLIAGRSVRDWTSGIGAIGGAGIGYAVGMSKLSAWQASYLSQSGGATQTGSTTTALTLLPGVMPQITLSLSNNSKLTATLPTGAQWAVQSGQNFGAPYSSSDLTVVGVDYNMPTATPNTVGFVALKVGNSTLTMSWTDSGGNSQTSTIPVIVTA
jgi:hypothetical protein